MALQTTIKSMKQLLSGLSVDLEKADGGNKAASQRVRTGTVRLEKVAKLYRKESIQWEKNPAARKRKASGKTTKKAATKKATYKTTKKTYKSPRRATAKLPCSSCR